MIGGMAPDIATTLPLRTHTELAQLVAAIVKASASDETDWLEWKRTLDLSSRISQGVIARTILGMANRTVATAMRSMGGFGYVVVGAEPGLVEGVTEVDPAQLGPAIQDYLGPDGPAWNFTYINAGPAKVLVITVEPPRSGDRIRTLNKESERHLRGTVLVRRPGQTIQANPDEVRAMEDRLVAPTLASRKRERMEKISEALDAAFDKVKEANTADRPQIVWTTQRNRLEDALEAWDGPEMVSVTNFVRAGTAYQALMYYSAARGEVKGQFFVLDQEQALTN
jgi:hypothetical protein